MLQEYRKEIEEYNPFDEQEQKDKEIMIYYMDHFEDTLTRKNELGHFTSSAIVLNETMDKILLIHHNIFQSWLYPGGHVDGEHNFLQVALKEVQEETGADTIKVLEEKIFAISNFSVLGHFKKGKYVSSHSHLDILYLFQIAQNTKMRIKPDENSGIKWVKIEEIDKYITYLFAKTMCPKLKEKLELYKREKVDE